MPGPLRVLAASFVPPGQSFPVVGVALELARRGHDVAYWAAAGSDKVVKGFGFRTVGAGRWRGGPGSGLPGAAAAVAPTPEGVVGSLASTYVDRLDDQLAEFGAVLDEVRPDVVVAGSMMVGLLLAAEAAGVPCVGITPTIYYPGGTDGPPPFLGLGPGDGVAEAWARWRAAEAPVLETLAKARAGLGLAERGHTLLDHFCGPDLQLVPSTPRIELPRNDVPAHVRYVGACAVDAAAAFSGLGPPPDLDPDPPAVLVTGGTVLHGDFVGEVVQALRGVVNVVALTWMADPARLHDPPAVHAARYAPMANVLPRVALVVSNGGSGGATAALAGGRPLVVVPGHSDQGDNAVRIAAAGAGVACAREPAAIRAAVERVLGEAGFTARAAELASDLADRGGAPAAAGMIEALVGFSSQGDRI